jgi:Spy/CpxP family protein refolding chaperone
MDGLFVQQLGPGLDSAAFDRYIANHMTNQRSGKSSFLNSIDGIELSVEIQRRKTMNRIRLLAIGAILMFALTTVAQQATAGPGGPAKGVSGDGGVPTAGKHLQVLTEKLDLTGDQQAKIKPILRELHDATLKLVQNESMSREERLDHVRASREKADKKIREILNDDQKKKLDQLEQEPHSALHGN